MKFDWKQPGFLLSALAHLALLLAALLMFSDAQKFDDAQETVAVEVVSDAQLNQVTKGDKNEKTVKPDAKTRVDKIAEVETPKPRPTMDIKADIPTPPPPLKRQIDPGEAETEPAKAVPTPPVKPAETAKAEPPKPAPEPPARPAEPPKPEPKPEPKTEPKPEPKPAPTPPKPVARPAAEEQDTPPDAEIVRPAPPKKPDLIAKALDTPTPEAKPTTETPPTPPKPKVRPHDKAAADKAALQKQIDSAAQKAALDQKLAEQEKATQEKAAEQKAALEKELAAEAAKDKAAKEQAAKDKAAKEKAAKDKIAKEQAAQDKADDLAQEKADAQKAAEKAAEKAANDKAANEKAAKDAAALLKPRSGDTSPTPKKDVLGDISKFLNKDKPQSSAATGPKPSQTASAGSETANAPKLTPAVARGLGAWLVDTYHQCWELPIYPTEGDYKPKLRLFFNPDGSLASPPQLLNPPADPAFKPLADSVLKAVTKPRCNPLHFPPEYAPFIKEISGKSFEFDPKNQ